MLATLYVSFPNTRLIRWVEDKDMRMRGHAGFRADHRTADQMFYEDKDMRMRMLV